MNFTVKLCVPSDRLNEASEAKGDKILYSKASLTTSNSFSSDFNYYKTKRLNILI